MYLQPVSWFENVDVINIFGYTLGRNEVCVSLKSSDTYLIDYGTEITEEIFDNFNLDYSPQILSLNRLNPNILTVYDPLIENEDQDGVDIGESFNSVGIFHKNPQSRLQSLFNLRGITPYDWIYIDEYRVVRKDSNNYFTDLACDRQIVTSASALHPITQTEKDNILAGITDRTTIRHRPHPPEMTIAPICNLEQSNNLLFFDIEVQSDTDNFTDAKSTDVRISLISIIVANNYEKSGYVILNGNVNESYVNNYEESDYPLNIIKTDDERGLLVNFFAIWTDSNPNIVLHYNGNSYDIPFILTRAHLNNIKIPDLGKIQDYSPKTQTVNITSPIGNSTERIWTTPGVENIDLIQYFRRFYPGMENYKLQTMGEVFLGHGKSGLEIERMFEIIRSHDLIAMAEVVDYSYQDTLLLAELEKELIIIPKLESLSNLLQIPMTDILNLRDNELIQRMMYNIDNSTALIQMREYPVMHLKEFEKGIHLNVTTYDYSELIAQAYLQDKYDDGLLWYRKAMADRVRMLPTKISNILLYSNYTPDSVRQQFQLLLQSLNPISIDDNFLYTVGKVNSPNLKSPTPYIARIVFDNKNYIMITDDNKILCYGLSDIVRPKFELMKEIVDRAILERIEGDIFPEVTAINLQNPQNLEKLIGHVKLRPSSSYRSKKSWQSRLSEIVEKRGKIITTWINTKYLFGKNQVIPIFDQNLPDPNDIDIDYYLRVINKNIYLINDLTIIK